jgi:hypothetical protein
MNQGGDNRFRGAAPVKGGLHVSVRPFKKDRTGRSRREEVLTCRGKWRSVGSRSSRRGDEADHGRIKVPGIRRLTSAATTAWTLLIGRLSEASPVREPNVGQAASLPESSPPQQHRGRLAACPTLRRPLAEREAVPACAERMRLVTSSPTGAGASKRVVRSGIRTGRSSYHAVGGTW